MTDVKTYSLAEIKKHSNDKSCWLLVHGKIYDVTAFLEEHPGGYDIILTSTGRDATQDFEEIGHSNSAKELLEKYYIGQYEGGDSAPVSTETKAAAASVAAPKQTSTGTRIFNVLLPILLLLVAIALNLFIGKK